MSDSNNFKLINGVFDAIEAREILTNIISSKIQFHSIRVFSISERFGINDQVSRERIEQLKETKIELLRLIEVADRNNKKLSITSNIDIRLVD